MSQIWIEMSQNYLLVRCFFVCMSQITALSTWHVRPADTVPSCAELFETGRRPSIPTVQPSNVARLQYCHIVTADTVTQQLQLF